MSGQTGGFQELNTPMFEYMAAQLPKPFFYVFAAWIFLYLLKYAYLKIRKISQKASPRPVVLVSAALCITVVTVLAWFFVYDFCLGALNNPGNAIYYSWIFVIQPAALYFALCKYEGGIHSREQKAVNFIVALLGSALAISLYEANVGHFTCHDGITKLTPEQLEIGR